MKTKFLRNVIPIVVALSLSSCFDDIKDELQKTRQTVSDSTKAIAEAVPGERLLRLIDYTNGKGTKQEQEEAREYIKSVFHLDLTKGYEASAWFVFDTARQSDLHADMFVAPTDSLVEVKSHCAYPHPDPPVSSVMPIPMTDAEVRVEIEKKVRNHLMDVNGGTNPALAVTAHAPSRHDPVCVTIGAVQQPWEHYEMEKHVKGFVTDLTDAILMVRGQRQLPASKEWQRKTPFNPLKGYNFVFVLINKEDFDHAVANGGDKNFTVNVLVHETDHPDHPLMEMPTSYLYAKEFTRSDHPVVHSETKGDFVWAVDRVGEYEGITEKALKHLKELRELAEKREADLKAEKKQ